MRIFTNIMSFISLLFGGKLPWPFLTWDSNMQPEDFLLLKERWNNPFLTGKESKILFYIFYRLSLLGDWLLFRYDELTHKPKRKKFLIYKQGKMKMFKNKLIGKYGKIPITDLRENCKPKIFFKRLFIFVILYYFFKIIFC